MTRAVRIFWKIFLYGFLSLALLIFLINVGLFGRMPSLAQLENPSIMQATEVYGDDGTQLGKYYKDKGNRSNVQYKDISKYVVDALVATEDERFYEHSGIDGRAVARAVFFLGKEGGASTITQQLALNMFSDRATNTISRILQKIKENIIAVKLERNFTKQEILALYLNTVSFSDNIYGIRNAARTFFSKEPDRLNIQEAAVLIGMLKATGTYNPRTNYKYAFDRRNTVIDQMVRNQYLTSEDAFSIKKEPIRLNYKKVNENNGIAPYFLDVIKDDLKKWCSEHKKPDGENYDLYEDGLHIYTTINPRMQLYAEEAVARHLPVLQRVLAAQKSLKSDAVWKGHENILENYMHNSDRWKNLKNDGMSDTDIRKTFKQKVHMKVFAWNPKREIDTLMTPLDSIKYHREMLQTAFMVTDPLSGQVKAWVGGIDFKNYKYDHANVKTKRQVGSSIKPFLYSLAIEEYGFTPETQCEATQQYFPGSGYVPAKNSGRTGTRTMASGLAWSINEVAAYIIKQTTPQRFADFLKQINIPTKVQPYPSIALGSCDLSLYEMMWGYSMFPTGGFSIKPVYITRIEDKNGNVLDQRFNNDRKEVISQTTAYTMARMMQGAVDFGTAAGLRGRLNVAEMGGKTGTTNDNSDAWFFGFTPQLMAGVWIGCDDRFIRLESGLGYGGQAARPIWEYFFQKALNDKTLGLDKQAMFVAPESMKNDQYYDFNNIIEHAPPPGAEMNDNGDEYLGKPDTQNIPTESKQAMEEQKVLKESKDNENQVKPRDSVLPEEKKKRGGFFKRLFGRKKDKDKEKEE